jgi:hypothetical protein
MSEKKRIFQVTIRLLRQVQQYEVFEVEAERFGDVLTESADLIEIRATNPAE